MGTPTFSDINLMMARINGQAARPGLRPPRVERAFVTQAAFSVGDHAYPAVVTGGYTNAEAGEFEVNFDILGYSGAEPVSLTIDRQDVEAMREVLGIGGEVDGLDGSEGLGKAGQLLTIEGLEALRKLAIAMQFQIDEDEIEVDEDMLNLQTPYMLRLVQRTCLILAAKIGRVFEAEEEGDDATQSDS